MTLQIHPIYLHLVINKEDEINTLKEMKKIKHWEGYLVQA